MSNFFILRYLNYASLNLLDLFKGFEIVVVKKLISFNFQNYARVLDSKNLIMRIAMANFKPSDPDYEARLRESFCSQGLMKLIGAEIISISPGHCEIRTPFNETVSQQHGFFHGGVVGAVADSAGGYSSFTLMNPGDGVLTVEYKLNFITPADGDELIASGRIIKSGRTLTVCHVDVFVVKLGVKKLCAVMQQTLMRVVGQPNISI